MPRLLLVLLALAATPLAAQQPRPAADTTFRELRFRMIGPARGGRVTTVTGITRQPGTFYMGASGGGVWKTDDYGEHWRNVSDGFFATPSIGAIQVADSDPNTVYVGTGSDAIRSNVITGLGVYKSADAGKTWQMVGLRDAGQIGAVEVDPHNPDRVFVAAMGHAFGPNRERGVYRSLDGGRRWKRVLFVSDSTGAVDLEFKPDDPQTIYAAMWRGVRKPWTIVSGAREGGIYRSTDGGDTWTRLGGGLPQGLVGKADLAVSAADPRRVYALVEAPDSAQGLYRSDDAGDTWRQVSRKPELMSRPFYFTNVTADPTNADRLWVGNVGWYASEDGGRTWERRATPHSDNHDLWINPEHPQVMVQANDGGANVSLDGGRSWSTQLNQPTAELYGVATDDQFPFRVYAGQQDNTTISLPSLPPTATLPDAPLAWWTETGGCETGPAVPQPGNPNIIFSNCKGRFGVFSRATGQERQFWVGAQSLYGHNPRDLTYRFQRVAPIAVSPHDPNTVYYGSQYLHRTRDGGQTWERISPDLTANRPEYQVISGGPINRDITGEEVFSTLYAIAESPRQRGVIWTGSNDGLVYLTRDDGKTWRDVTPRQLPANARIQTVEPSPHDPAEAYVAAYRTLLDDYRPFIFRTTDYGRTWKLLTTGRNGIPADHPTRVVREDPARDGLLYAGTDWGIFVSWDEGAHWQRLQQNLPVTPVTDIQLHGGDLALATMGRSFWVLDDVAPLRQWSRDVARTPLHLFAPDTATRMRYNTYGDDDPALPEYPPVGAYVDYRLATEPAGEVRLEILDARGATIRAFSSAAADTAARSGDPRLGTPRLPKTAGLHRFRWELQLPGPWDANLKRSGRGGPMVVPGTYQVRLTGGGRSRTQPLVVRLDPRVAASGVSQADVEAQLALNLRLRDAVSEARLLARRVTAAGPRLASLRARLVTAEGQSYPQPMLVDQLEYLYGMTTTADQRPGRDAFDRYTELRRELDAALAEARGAGVSAGTP